MFLDDVVAFAETVKAYRAKGGKETDIDKMVLDIHKRFPRHPEWLEAIKNYTNAEVPENETTPLCNAYTKVKELFTKGFPPLKLFPELPIPAVVLAKLSAEATKMAEKGLPVMEEVVLKQAQIANAKADKQLESLNQQGGGVYFTDEDCNFF